MNEKLASQLRHLATFVPGLGTFLLALGWLDADTAMQLDAEQAKYLAVLAGALAVMIARGILWLVGKYAPRLLPLFPGIGKGSSMLAMATAAGLLMAGGLLSSCSAWNSFTGDFDAKGEVVLLGEGGAKAGLKFQPGKPMSGFARLALRDPDTGAITGYTDIEISPKAKVIEEKSANRMPGLLRQWERAGERVNPRRMCPSAAAPKALPFL